MKALRMLKFWITIISSFGFPFVLTLYMIWLDRWMASFWILTLKGKLKISIGRWSVFFKKKINSYARERFPHLYKECFVLHLNRCGISLFTLLHGPASSLALVPFSNRHGTSQSTSLWDPVTLLAHRLVSTPLRGSASSLAHRPVSGSDAIWNGSSPPLADIVFFGFSLSGFLWRFLKHVYTEEGFTSL